MGTKLHIEFPVLCIQVLGPSDIIVLLL